MELYRRGLKNKTNGVRLASMQTLWLKYNLIGVIFVKLIRILEWEVKCELSVMGASWQKGKEVAYCRDGAGFELIGTLSIRRAHSVQSSSQTWLFN